ncbi:hypothetical protein SOASR029_35590 [Budvicia aquatica]|nr:hypothetical protein SOASR029_35590 [Budvicia aquatica]
MNISIRRGYFKQSVTGINEGNAGWWLIDDLPISTLTLHINNGFTIRAKRLLSDDAYSAEN